MGTQAPDDRELFGLLDTGVRLMDGDAKPMTLTWPHWWQSRRVILGVCVMGWHLHVWCFGARVLRASRPASKFWLYEFLIWRFQKVNCNG